MNGPITQTASFTNPPKLIALSGNMLFGYVVAGNSSSRVLTVSNAGDFGLTVSGIGYPSGFSGAWAGDLAAGGSTNVSVIFVPAAETNYSGTLTVHSAANSGSNTLAVFGAGVLQTNDIPPAQNILQATVNPDGSVTITYATSAGFPYHVETANGLAPAFWTVIAASATNAATGVVSFTDPNPQGGAQRFYRVVSP